MANQEHLDILKQGVEVWNKWREAHPDLHPDFAGAELKNVDLYGADLYGADFRNSNLRDSDLQETDLTRAKLNDANLSNVNLLWADLRNADFANANLSNADLPEANLSCANLSGANLYRTNLTRANLNGTNFAAAELQLTILAAVDLSQAKGLDTVIDMGPSIIDIDTIYRSNGNIPEAFFRNAGIPDSFITYMRLLVVQPLEYLSCFISHSSNDNGFCDRLYADLQFNGVRCWYFPQNAKWGEPVWGEIDRSIKVYDKLIVVCSEQSLQSGPVQREIERALNREDRERKNILFPIRIDNYLFKGWEHPRKDDVISKVVGDFREWERSAIKYDIALKKLLSALKTIE